MLLKNLAGMISALAVLVGTLLGGNSGTPPAATTTTTTPVTPTTTTPATTTTTTTPATTTTTTTTTTTIPKEPRPSIDPPGAVASQDLTKVRVTIESTSPWVTVDLLGGRIVQSTNPSSPGGSSSHYSTTGFAVQTNTSTRMVADAVYEIEDDILELIVCKDSPGTVSARVERVTEATAVEVVSVQNARSDGVRNDGCANRATVSVDAEVAAPLSVWPRPVVDERLTLAIYSPWYDAGTLDRHAFVDRPLDPFDATTSEGVSGMIDVAADAGVDGFVYWYNGEERDNDERLRLLMDEAAKEPGFRVTPLFDASAVIDRQGSINSANTLAWTLEMFDRAQGSALHRVDGRPVLFVWGTRLMKAATWRAARDAMRADGFDPFVVGDSPDPAFDFDGFWVLNPNTEKDTSTLPNWYRWWADEARFGPTRSLGDKPVLWAAGISPGEDDTYSGKQTSIWLQIPRSEGARYRDVWKAAAGSRPEWMVISSWNDLHEATYIIPSERLGSRELDETRSWTRWFSTQG